MAGSNENNGAVDGGAEASGAAFDGAVPSRGAGNDGVAVAAAAGSDVPGADGVLVRRHLALSMVTERYEKGGLQQEPFRPGSVIPTTLRQAKALPDGQHFLEAASSEMSSLEAKGVLGYRQSLPAGVRALPTHFVFAVKR